MNRDVDHIAEHLIPRASLLTRLLLRQSGSDIPRSEAGVLGTLGRGARRITDLAEHEGLAQPTMTLLIKRLEKRGWVARERDEADGRAVLVSLTPAGFAAVQEARAGYRAVLQDRLRSMTDAEVAALTTATDALGGLVEALQRGDER
jgi:DNA-binding MarR family transcriptional regulator